MSRRHFSIALILISSIGVVLTSQLAVGLERSSASTANPRSPPPPKSIPSSARKSPTRPPRKPLPAKNRRRTIPPPGQPRHHRPPAHPRRGHGFRPRPRRRQAGQIVTQLLADPRYGQNWGRYWRDVIMYRKTEERAAVPRRHPARFLSGRLVQRQQTVEPNRHRVHHRHRQRQRKRGLRPDRRPAGAAGRDRRRSQPHFPRRADSMCPVPRPSHRPLEARAVS